MNINVLQSEMIAAMKSGDKIRKETISGMIDSARKATITSKGRVELTDEIVEATILKEQKMVQEMIDTCPADRTELMAAYVAKMNVIKEFAPVIEADPEQIKIMIVATGIEVNKANRGKIMGALKGKVDMKVANQVVTSMM